MIGPGCVPGRAGSQRRRSSRPSSSGGRSEHACAGISSEMYGSTGVASRIAGSDTSTSGSTAASGSGGAPASRLLPGSGTARSSRSTAIGANDTWKSSTGVTDRTGRHGRCGGGGGAGAGGGGASVGVTSPRCRLERDRAVPTGARGTGDGRRWRDRRITRAERGRRRRGISVRRRGVVVVRSAACDRRSIPTSMSARFSNARSRADSCRQHRHVRTKS